MNLKWKLVLILICIFGLKVDAQYVVLGQEPSSLHWYQVRTPHFQLIFPENFNNKANSLANELEYAYQYYSKNFGFCPKSTRIIVHTGTVESNAISLLAPNRAEFFMTPPQNIYTHGWQEQLVVHEYRHMVQLASLRQGFTRLLSIPLGDYAQVLTYGLFTPMWYMEGDAVVMETALSHSGRGRLPGFEMNMKAQLLDKGMFKFQKARFGSYKDYIPDQYYFGYFFIALCRERYGPDLWNKGMNLVARKPFLLDPLDLSFKKQIGFNKKTLYDTLFNDLSGRFQQVKQATPVTHFKKINTPEKKIYTNYKFPHYLNDSTVIAEKSGMADIARIVSININSGKEKVLCSPGFYASETLPSITPVNILGQNSPGAFTADNLSLDRRKVCWAEKKYHPRWQFKNYSVIMVYDIEKKEKIQLTHQSSLFAPVFFPGRDSILAVEVKSDSSCNLVIINSLNGSIISRLPNPLKDFYMIPSVNQDGSQIAVVAYNQEGKSIKVIDINHGSSRTIVGPTYEEISFPHWYKHYIVYSDAISGVDNIFAVDLYTLKKYQVTSAVYGAYQPDFNENNNKFIYSQYTSDGFEIVESAMDTTSWIPVEGVTYHGIALYKSFLTQEKGMLDLEHASNIQYELKPYRKAMHLFNPHSWAPASISIGEQSVHPGISFASQNMLSTSVLNAGYAYIPQEKSAYYYFGYTYSGVYPVFDMGVRNSERDNLLMENQNEQHFHWSENKVTIGIRLPLISTCNNYFQKWEMSADWENYHLSGIKKLPIAEFNNFNNAKFSFTASNYQKTTLRDMAPRWGQSIRLTGNKSLDELVNDELTGSCELFFPGLRKHHSFKLGFDAYQRSEDAYPFIGTVRYPRGYLHYYHDRCWYFSGDYKFPLLYPDFNVGSILYMKRLKLDLFYDYAEGNNESLLKIYRSFGYELSSDINFFGLFIPINLGIRHSYLPAENLHQIEALLSISFEGI